MILSSASSYGSTNFDVEEHFLPGLADQYLRWNIDRRTDRSLCNLEMLLIRWKTRERNQGNLEEAEEE